MVVFHGVKKWDLPSGISSPAALLRQQPAKTQSGETMCWCWSKAESQLWEWRNQNPLKKKKTVTDNSRECKNHTKSELSYLHKSSQISTNFHTSSKIFTNPQPVSLIFFGLIPGARSFISMLPSFRTCCNWDIKKCSSLRSWGIPVSHTSTMWSHITHHR